MERFVRFSKVLHEWGFVYLNSSYDFVEEDEDHDDPTPSAMVGGVGGQFFARKGMLLKCVLQTDHKLLGFYFTAVHSSLKVTTKNSITTKYCTPFKCP